MKNIKLSFKILKQRMIIFALILITFFIPQMTQNENSIDARVLITALGIDKKQNEYEVSAQVFIPSKTSTTKDIISATDKSVTLAAEKLFINTVRLAVPATCQMIVLGKDLVEQENVMNTLDYILRKNIISWNAIIVTGEKSAVETLKGLNKLEEKSSMGWQSLYNISERGFDMVAVKVRDFAKGVYGLTGTSLLPIVEAKDTPPENQGGSSGSSGGGGGGSSGGSSSQGSVSLSENDCIFTQSDGGSQGQSSQGNSEENKGQGPQLKLIPDTLVFFRGKKIARLNKDQTEGINWLSKKALFHSFTLENIGGYYFKDSKVSLSLKNQKIKIKSKFDSNPTMDVKIDANFTLVEVMRSDIPLIAGKHDHVERSELLSKKINDFIEKQVRDAFETGKEKDADVFNFVPYFFKFHNKQYNKYMSTGRKVTDLLKDIELKLDIKTDVEV